MSLELFGGEALDGASVEEALRALELNSSERSLGVALAALLRDAGELYIGGDDSESVLVMCAQSLPCREAPEDAERVDGVILEAGLRHASSEDFVWQIAGPLALKAAFAFWRARPQSPLLFRVQGDASIFLPVLAQDHSREQRFLLTPSAIKALAPPGRFFVEMPSCAVAGAFA